MKILELIVMTFIGGTSFRLSFFFKYLQDRDSVFTIWWYNTMAVTVMSALIVLIILT